jgi:hypothetical protein
VLVKKERQEVAALAAPPAGAPPGVSCYKVSLKAPIKAGASLELDVVATITGVFNPNPAKIEQTENQYVQYADNLYLLSPYAVNEQTTVVRVLGVLRRWPGCAERCLQPAGQRVLHPACPDDLLSASLANLQATLPSSDIKSHTELQASKSGSKVTFGPYAKQGPWAVQELKLHFHHPKPFKRVSAAGSGMGPRGPASHEHVLPCSELQGHVSTHTCSCDPCLLPRAPLIIHTHPHPTRTIKPPQPTHTHTHATHTQINKLVREIEVSHWGNIYVEEHYEIVSR